MAVATLTLVANPGSASRKYGLYHEDHCLARLHFEHQDNQLVCSVWTPFQSISREFGDIQIEDSIYHVRELFEFAGVLKGDSSIDRVAIRIVAPGSFFLDNRIVDDEFLDRFKQAAQQAPLHVGATLVEIQCLRSVFSEAQIVGVSDSKFHVTKPDYAWNYGLPLDVADRFGIKRFGYHGLSVAGALRRLHESQIEADRIIICHLGSGSSVTAVREGVSIDTTMGFSPLEGVVMATRSGSVDAVAVHELSRSLGLSHEETLEYLNNRSGLLGLSGSSSDIRELIERESAGDYRASLALNVMVYSIQKSIGQMAAVLNGVDALVFTGTVGERSAIIRRRIVENLRYLDFAINPHTNEPCLSPTELTWVSDARISKPIYVVPTDETREMIRAAITAVSW